MAGPSDYVHSDKPVTMIYDMTTGLNVPFECVRYAEQGRHLCSKSFTIIRYFANRIFTTSKLTVFPLQEMLIQATEFNFLVCYVLEGQLILEHNRRIDAGQFFVVSENAVHSLCNLLEEEAIIMITEIKLR